MFKQAHIKYNENYKFNVDNFFKEGITFVEPNPIKTNIKGIVELREDLEIEFQNQSCPPWIPIDQFKNKILKNQIEGLFKINNVSKFLHSFYQKNKKEKVFLFPYINVMRNYYSGPQVGLHGWHNDLNGELRYPFCKKRIISGDYIFGKLSIPLQYNGIIGGNIDIAKATYKKTRASSLRQRISLKLQREILKIIKKSPSLPKFMGNQWITDLFAFITKPRSINPKPLTIVAFSHRLYHRGTPQSPLGWKLLQNKYSSLNLEHYQIENIDLKEQNKFMIYAHFGNKVGLESYLYDRSRRDGWENEYLYWTSQFKNLNIFTNVFSDSEIIFRETCEKLKINN